IEDHARKASDVGRQLTGHAEVQPQPEVARLREEMLAVAPHARELPAGQCAQGALAYGEDALVEHAHPGDGAPQPVAGERAGVALDFRKLRHVRSLCAMARVPDADPNALEPRIRAVLEGQRKKWGAPL